MAEIAGAKALGLAQVGFKRDFKALLQPVITQASGLLVRAAGNNENKIPKAAEKQLVTAIGESVQRVFVGTDGRSAFADDGVTAIAPYPAALNTWYALITAEIVRTSAKSMKAVIKDDAVYRWLAAAQPPENATVGGVSELTVSARTTANFVRDSLLEYDPMHFFVNPVDGYRLSDRIWQTSLRTRTQVDALLAEGIRNGEGSLRLSRRLEQFLLPGAALVRTSRPYGTDASYSGMRLARTEITAAGGRSTMLAGRLNPYVTGITWRLSLSHPRSDICNGLAAGSPYDFGATPSYPAHPHCLCTLVQNVTTTPAQVTSDLRELMENGQPAPLTPANAEGLLSLILGAALYGLLRGIVQS